MAITREDLEAALKNAFPAAQIKITDLAGDNNHWAVEIVDDSFKNLSRLEQHKRVQRAVSAYEIHALQIKTAS